MRRMIMTSLVLFSMSLWGCRPSFQYLRTVNPYTKQQTPEPYAQVTRIVGGAQLKVLKFYVTPKIGCAVMEVDNSRGEVPLYINPHKAQFVVGKLGIWSMKSSMAAREDVFRQMATDFYKLDPQKVPRWSAYYFPLGTIKPKEKREGLICFQFARKDNDPKALIPNKRCRMRLTGALLGGGSVNIDWIYLEPLKK